MYWEKERGRRGEREREQGEREKEKEQEKEGDKHVVIVTIRGKWCSCSCYYVAGTLLSTLNILPYLIPITVLGDTMVSCKLENWRHKSLNDLLKVVVRPWCSCLWGVCTRVWAHHHLTLVPPEYRRWTGLMNGFRDSCVIGLSSYHCNQIWFSPSRTPWCSTGWVRRGLGSQHPTGGSGKREDKRPSVPHMLKWKARSLSPNNSQRSSYKASHIMGWSLVYMEQQN